jgi:hypothetical protein
MTAPTRLLASAVCMLWPKVMRVPGVCLSLCAKLTSVGYFRTHLLRLSQAPCYPPTPSTPAQGQVWTQARAVCWSGGRPAASAGTACRPRSPLLLLPWAMPGRAVLCCAPWVAGRSTLLVQHTARSCRPTPGL